jgi:hypothetical protein
MSRQSISLFSLAVKAAAALTAHRMVTAAGAVPAAGAACLGPTASAAATGDLVNVHILGTALVEAGAEITANQYLAADNQGRVVPYTDGNVCVGQAAPGAVASGAGVLLEVLLIQSPPLQVIA